MTTGVGIGYSAFQAAYEMLVPISQVAAVTNPADLAVGLEAAAGLEAAVPPAAPEERSNIENIAALGISGASIMAKEFLFRYTL